MQKLRVLKAIAKQTSYQDKTLDVVNDRYFRSEQEMKELYDVEDLERAEAIAKQCNVQMSFKKSTLPTFENNLHIDNETYLIKLCKAGLEKRLNHQENLVYKSVWNMNCQSSSRWDSPIIFNCLGFYSL